MLVIYHCAEMKSPLKDITASCLLNHKVDDGLKGSAASGAVTESLVRLRSRNNRAAPPSHPEPNRLQSHQAKGGFRGPLRSQLLGGCQEATRTGRHRPATPGASRGLRAGVPACSLPPMPSKPRSRADGSKASVAEIVFSRFSFGVSFSLPVTLPGELRAPAARL